MPGTSVVTLRANANGTLVGTTCTLVGGAFAPTILGDNSDASYITDGAGDIDLKFPASGLSDLDIVQNVRVRWRASDPSLTAGTAFFRLYDPATRKGTYVKSGPFSASAFTYDGPAWTSIGGQKITRAVLDRIEVVGGIANTHRIYEMYLDIFYNQRPTISSISPSGTVLVSSPPITWLYCADEETEVLTREGWKQYDEASTDDHLLTLDHETGLSEWQQPSSINIFGAEPRQLIRMEGTQHSSLTTPNHRWPVETYTQHRKGERSRFDVRRFRETADLRWGDRIPCAVPCRDLPAEPKYADDLVELVAWFWTEGEILPGGGLRIVQSRKVNDPYVARIRRCLMRLYGPEAMGSMNRGGRYRLVEPLWKEGSSTPEMARFALNKSAAQPILDAAPGKVVSPAFIAALTEAQLRLFVETSLDADGWRSGSRRGIGQNSEARLDPFEMACALLGIRTTRHEWNTGMWTTQLHRGNYIRPRLAASHKVAFSITEETYSGHVWCPTTPNGTWLARRRGTVYWTGNTDPEGDRQESVDVVVMDSALVTTYAMTTAPTHLELAAYVIHAFPTSGTAFSHPDLLLHPGSYRIFMRAFDAGSNRAPSVWAHSDINVVLSTPATPTVVVSTPFSEQFGRVGLTVQGFDNLLTLNQASSEGTTADYGVTNATPTIDATSAGLWSDPAGKWASTKSLKIVLTSTATATVVTPTTYATGVPVVPGTAYTAGANVRSPVERLATANISWADASNTLISTTLGRQTPTPSGSQPAPVFVTGVAPIGAVRAVLQMQIIGSLNTEVHYFDDFYIAPTESAPLQDSAIWNANLVANTSFETYAGSSGAADWALINNGAGQTVGVIADTFDSATFGPQSMNVAKAEGALAPPYVEWPNLAGSVPRLPCTAGDVVIVSGFHRALIGGGVTVEAVYQDATHDQVTCAPQATGWEKFVAAFQIPTGKTGVSFRFLPVAVAANAAQGTVHLDMINVAFANTATVALFHSLGGASGTPLGAGNAGTISRFGLTVPPQPYFPWTPGGYGPNLAFVVERSDDAGVTWATVRGLPAPSADYSAVGWDYEATPNTRVLYRASATSHDSVGNPVLSPLTTPALADPGFEEQSWTGVSADPLSAQFQPPNGAFVGALDGTSSGLQSATASLPTYAASVGLRFLARAINCGSTNAQIRYFDFALHEISATNVPITVPAGGADTGWKWYETAVPVVAPSTAQYVDIFIPAPSAVDILQQQLFVVDTVVLWIVDVNGLANSVTTPTCEQWLKDPLNPGANLKVHMDAINLAGSGSAQATGLESTSLEPQLVLQPSGRGTAVVVADTIDGEVFGTIQLTLFNDGEWRAFETLRNAQRALLLQLPYGDLTGEQRYVRLGDVRSVGRITSQQQSQRQMRRVSIAAREVDAP